MKYNKGKWSQGCLLINSNTRRWSEQERRHADDAEKKRVFANFYGEDEGRSRIGICVCTDLETAEGDARRIAACVNACAGIRTESLESGLIKHLLDDAYMMTLNPLIPNPQRKQDMTYLGKPVYEEDFEEQS